ncbi:uncharacterized protein ATNIH1004_011789 [Aspergillus tanneri]|uniref:Uncharacterized protein n=1 Tax=Aspergillus tanneri TaxID=1220188 RepID=A0A5M9M9Q5_9EURO|nr:uncharacterized protein ATNIH1004_011789 [Aspergillus tanneri]KAA8641653.1 hypothetical protein ATNIH1004_011789 [Aspergillus tanneri]
MQTGYMVSSSHVSPGRCLEGAITDSRYDFEELAANDCKSLNQKDTGRSSLKIERCTRGGTLGRYLDGPLPKGKLQQFSVQWQSYQLFATTKLLVAVLTDPSGGALLPPVTLAQELGKRGHVELGPDEWWAPSTRNLFGDDNLRQKRDRFGLLIIENVDAMGNKTMFGNDYARLRPTLITDANGNRAQTALNPLGRRVGVAVMGKKGEPVGDSLDKFSADLTEDQLQQFFGNQLGTAEELLQYAGRQTIYGSGWFGQEKVSPAFQAELVRDTHYKDGPAQISISLTYFSGNDRATQGVRLSKEDQANEWQLYSALASDKGHAVKESAILQANT